MLRRRRQLTPRQINQEELQEFWEWCGFTHKTITRKYTGKAEHDFENWYSPSGEGWTDTMPPLDLNNLFKYAVPKLGKMVTLYKFPTQEFWTAKVGATTQARDNDPALALYQAIQKARRNKNV